MATVNATAEPTSTTRLHYLAAGLAVVTGAVHLLLGLSNLGGSLGPPFVLAGLGFFGGVALFVWGVRRRLLYALGIPFTAVQFVLYFVFNWPNVTSPLGLADKAVQLALMAVLFVLYRRGR